MTGSFTRGEVGRILGVSQRQLHYWERLRLVRPRARWGERFYSFADLVAADTVKRLTDERVPARRLRRALLAFEQHSGQLTPVLAALRVLPRGREVAVTPPGPRSRPIEPLTGQFLLPLEARGSKGKLHQMSERSAEEWFEIALLCDADLERISESLEAYRRAAALAPEWVAPRINLGVALYRCGELGQAEQVFRKAVEMDPQNAVAQFNLGCVLEEKEDHDGAILHLQRAIELCPSHADAHFNLALAYESRGDLRLAREHWSQYLRYQPNGSWADYARAHLERTSRRPAKPIPFRKPS